MSESNADVLQCHSPIDGALVAERPLVRGEALREALARAVEAQRAWRGTSISERQRIGRAAVTAFKQHTADIAREITLQMGRPIAYAPGEVAGFAERAHHMIDIAPQALADVRPEPAPGFERYVRRLPLGVVFVVAPWNYPYLTAVNSVMPALMAGNSVLLKHSSQTPLCSERMADAFTAAGAPDGLLQSLHLDHEATLALVADPAVDYVAFTGSVDGGRAIVQAAAPRFIATGLELGGKDPAYVRPDADLAHAADCVVDGAFFNSGQSCCGIERVYVHTQVYDDFVERMRALALQYRLGDPREPETTLGPMVRASAADFVRKQTQAAIAAGARGLIDASHFPADAPGTPYLAPQILVDVDHGMSVMMEESFGPVVGVMRVASDDEAVALMNDSPYGLTAALFSRDVSVCAALGERIETGTVFLNRCDYLDPALAWTGIKDSGRGCTLSALGYESLTRPKSFHLKRPTD